jgi:hypothetical protein
MEGTVGGWGVYDDQEREPKFHFGELRETTLIGGCRAPARRLSVFVAFWPGRATPRRAKSRRRDKPLQSSPLGRAPARRSPTCHWKVQSRATLWCTQGTLFSARWCAEGRRLRLARGDPLAGFAEALTCLIVGK